LIAEKIRLGKKRFFGKLIKKREKLSILWVVEKRNMMEGGVD